MEKKSEAKSEMAARAKFCKYANSAANEKKQRKTTDAKKNPFVNRINFFLSPRTISGVNTSFSLFFARHFLQHPTDPFAIFEHRRSWTT